MSFILDALKKSETDRQRQNGPALYEVRVAPPRNALPLWAIGLAVLLAVNLIIVACVLLRRPASAEAPAQAANVQSPNATMPATTMVPASTGVQQAPTLPPTPTSAVPVSGTVPTAPLAQTAGMTQPQQGAPPMTNAGQTAVGPPGSVTNAPAPQPAPNTSGTAGAGENETLRAQTDTGADKLNPDDTAPAADPGPAQPFGSHVARATASGVPLYQDVALNTRLPNLRLDLHVFAAQPQERFVMINMHKLHEGDSMPTEGVRVESITPGGVVLSHDGTKFLLPKD